MKLYLRLLPVILVALPVLSSTPFSSWCGRGVAAVPPDSLPPLPIDSLRWDSLRMDSRMDTLASDSTKDEKKAGIDAPVEYTVQDSMVYVAETGLAHLFGSSVVTYQGMRLSADRITMNMDSTLVHAEGTVDTLGNVRGQPVYAQGGDTYDSERMSFNFHTKKGFIYNVATKQGNGFLNSEESKRADDGTLYLRNGRYTTCDAENPHFYWQMTKAKVYPGKEVIFGPAYLVVLDIPLPIAVPYGFFPFNSKYSSGFIMPSYGDETSRGFYLKDGGYYFALNDRMDLTVLGEIYTRGSWGISVETNYKRRYKRTGNFYFSYINTVDGEKNMPDYSVTKSLKLQWTHTQDAKANPNSSFSARVNFASESYERSNLSSLYNPYSYTQSTRTSSVSYSYSFPDIGLSISAATNLSQNMRDSSISLTLPDVTISLSRVYPFKRKNRAGKERWYEKISFSYTGKTTNGISTTENHLLHANFLKEWENGMQHKVPVQATFQLFKYVNVTPSFSLTDYMYFSRVERSWDVEKQEEVRDTVSGFYNLYEWSSSLSMNTTLYGFFIPNPKVFGNKIVAVRHVFEPNISISYSPDFTTDRYGYTKTYIKTDEYGEETEVSYSPYSGAPYGYPSSSKSGTVTMSVSNNLEMKVRSDRDSSGTRIISLIDELYASLSYNLAAKVRPWGNLNTRLRLKLTKSYTFSLNSTWATYAYKFNESGNVVVSDRTEWSYGRFGRFSGLSQNLSYTLNNSKLRQLWEKITGRSKKDEDEGSTNMMEDDEEYSPDTEEANLDPDMQDARRGGRGGNTGQKARRSQVDEDGYLAFSLPWSLTISYGISMYEDTSKKINVRRMRYPYSFTQTLNLSGHVRIAEGWDFSFSSGYDFENHAVSMTTASVSRDLHCFEMSCSMVLAPYTSFNFTFKARSSELADVLKWEKRSSYSSNVEWY